MVALLATDWLAASIPLFFYGLIVTFIVGPIAIDVKRKDGPTWIVLVLGYVFLPASIYLWAYTRGRYVGRVDPKQV